MSKPTLSLRARLMAGFLAASGLTVLVGCAGYYGLSRALSDANGIIAATKERGRFVTQSVDLARSAQVNFKKQVQEWKDTLLRGGDQAMFDKYFGAFASQESITQANLAALGDLLRAQGLPTTELDAASQEHLALGVRYRDAIKAYDRSRPDAAQVVDAKVKGMDRATTDRIDGIVAAVQKFDLETTRDREAAFQSRPVGPQPDAAQRPGRNSPFRRRGHPPEPLPVPPDPRAGRAPGRGQQRHLGLGQPGRHGQPGDRAGIHLPGLRPRGDERLA